MARLYLNLNGGYYAYSSCSPTSIDANIINYIAYSNSSAPCSEGDSIIIKDRLTGVVLASCDAVMSAYKSISAPNGVTIERGSILECSDDSDCSDGEKCVDGECVPCDEQQATHFQIRAEFEELVTLPDGSQTMYLLSSVYPIGSGVSNQIIQLAECNGVWYYPRIRFCDASGAIRPYTGALSFYGYCNPDGSSAMWVNNFNAIEDSHLLGQKAKMDLHFASPLSVPRILVEFIEPSEIIYETDCSNITPVDPPDIEPVEPIQPDKPDEPVEPPEEPLEPSEPLPPTSPPQPQEGLCPCEEYIGLQIKRAADILYDGLILLKRELSVVGREIVVELWEKRKMDYQLSMFFQNQQFQLMQAHHQRLFEIRQILESIRDDIKKGLIEGNDGLVDIVKTGLQEGDKGLVDFVKDFVEQYEPVTIENEYRTQSHRVIDNLDEVVNKL